MEAPSDDSRVRRALVQRLESLERGGLTHLKKGRARHTDLVPTGEANEGLIGKTSPAPRKAAVAGNARDALLDKPAVVPGKAPTGQAGALSVIQNEVAGCVRCPQLAGTRTQTVFGVGNPQARL